MPRKDQTATVSGGIIPQETVQENGRRLYLGVVEVALLARDQFAHQPIRPWTLVGEGFTQLLP